MNPIRQHRTLLSAIGLLATGWMFYIAARGWDPIGLFSATGPVPPTHSWIWAVPSLLHAWAAALAIQYFFASKLMRWSVWLSSTLGYEFLQAVLPKLGTFDWMDVAAITAVGLIAWMLGSSNTSHIQPRIPFRWPAQVATIVVTWWSSVATSYYPHSVYQTYEPICMDAQTFRQSFAVEAPRDVAVAGKILVQGDYLLVSEPFQGIHIFDNADPSAPVAKAFLKILGNTELAMKDDLLYADSGVDLLVIRLSPDHAELVSRQENMLSSSSADNFEGDLSQTAIEQCTKSGGIVVGTRERKDGDDFERQIERNKND